MRFGGLIFEGRGLIIRILWYKPTPQFGNILTFQLIIPPPSYKNTTSPEEKFLNQVVLNHLKQWFANTIFVLAN